MSTVPPSTPPPGGTYTPPPPPPPPPVGGGPAPGSSDRSVMIVLSYLSLLCLIPLLTKKDDPEVQWHAKNGLCFVIFDIVVLVGWTIIHLIISRIVPLVGCGMSFIGCAIWIGLLAIHVMAIIKGINGQRFRLPVVSDFADKM